MCKGDILTELEWYLIYSEQKHKFTHISKTTLPGGSHILPDFKILTKNIIGNCPLNASSKFNHFAHHRLEDGTTNA